MGIAVEIAPGVATWRERRRVTLLAGGVVMGLVLATTSAVIAANGPASHPAPVALCRALMVAAPIAVGLYAWQRRPAERFGPLLIGAGVAWFLTTFAESGTPLLYSFGRVAGWGAELVLVALFLAFPTGRIRARTDRRLLGATGLLVGMLYVPTALVVAQYPLPGPYTSCRSGCPANAFQAWPEPAFVGDVLIPAREVLVLLVVGVVMLRLAQRIRAGSPPMRRMLVPVLSVGIARLFLLGAAIVSRRAGATQVAADLVWLLALALPAATLAFLVGLLRTRLHVAQTIETLGARLRDHLTLPQLRRAFADAFGDPTVEIAFSAVSPGGGWIDATGDPVRMPEPGDGRSATEIRDGDTAVAVILHDEALCDQRELVEAGGGIALMLLENERLSARVEASTLELRRSRERIMAGADRERRRIERDLHDGAQQRLVALRIELGLAGDLVGGDPEVLTGRLQRMAEDVDEALDDIRSLAHGVYPALLADRGLTDALRDAVLRSPVPARIDARGIGRYAPEIESAVYFVSLEALQNVAKHAEGATVAVVSLAEEGGELKVSIRDDGVGAEPDALHGHGMTNMRDRLDAVGGELEVASAPGVGTVVSARVAARPGTA